ncbi:MAG: threonine synthase [Candidatus Bathyarchaeia archaeon]|nr:threonine synthase [Candidatus Bathyarchaeota archaeon]
MKALRCRECGETYPPARRAICEECFGPLDVVYNYEGLSLDRESFRGRRKSLWRYIDLLPIEDPSNIIELNAGFTPLHNSKRLAEALGLKNLYIKDDTVNPTYSFKDRPAAVAVSKALEFNIKVVGCPSTGNLAAATAAHAAKAGLPCYIIVPYDIEPLKVVQASMYGAEIVKVKGTYDDANRLAAQASEEYGWAFVNIDLRPYYVEGSKTLAFEVCEQLDWEPPDHVIVPMASGALLCAIYRGFKELSGLGLTPRCRIKITGVQPEGCAPIVKAYNSKDSYVMPMDKPDTIAKSLAIGDPGDGIYALKSIRESSGTAVSVSDKEIVEGIKLLARKEGIFAEPAGGATIAALRKLADSGLISRDEHVTCYVTGNGLKTVEALEGSLPYLPVIEPKLEALRRLLEVTA